MTLHDFLGREWTPPHPWERIHGVVEVRDYLLIITTSRIWKVEDDTCGFRVLLVGHHG